MVEFRHLLLSVRGWSFIAHLNQYDNDGDRILDVLEDAWSVSYPGILSSGNFNDAVQDYDNDGLMNFEEVALGLNPGNAHSRNSAVHDLQEWAWRGIIYQTGVISFNGTAPAEWNVVLDNDNTHAPDGLESFVAALNAGTAGVALPQRVAGGDYDGDGMPDVWEQRYVLNLRDASDANANNDGDSLTNVQEFASNPPRDPLVNDDPPPPPLTLSGSAGGGAVGEAYSTTFTASGGTPGYSYSISSGTLPDGLSLDSSSGVISGTPSNGGSFEFFITVNDSAWQTASTSYGINIAGLEIATGALPAAIHNAPYTATISAVHGTAPYSFVNVGNDLPVDYSLASDGTLTSTPDGLISSATGSYAFTVEVTDSAGRTATKTLTLVIENPPPPPPLRFVTTQLPYARVGFDYSCGLIVDGAQGTPTFSISGQPDWLQMAANGTLSGMPPTTGSWTFSVQVRDESYDETLGQFRTASATFTLQESGNLPAVVTIVSGNFQNGQPGGMLPAPLAVRVTLDGAPLGGATVAFGDLILATNASGIATTDWRCPAAEGGFQVPVSAGAGSALFQAWAITPRGGNSGPHPVFDVNALAGTPPTASTQNLLADDAEVIVESRFINENGGEVEASYGDHVYQMAAQGAGMYMVLDDGGPTYSHTKKNWTSSDGGEGTEPPQKVPLMEELEQWVPGAGEGYHYQGKDGEYGYIDGIAIPEGMGLGSPIVLGFLTQLGTYFEGGWQGRAQGMYQRTTVEVRLRRKAPISTTPPADTPVPLEIKRPFLLVTYETDELGVETITHTEVRYLTMSQTENASLPLLLAPSATAPGKSKRLRLLPIEISVPSSISTSMGVDSSAPKPTVSYKTATEVNIATWENSFEHANPERLVRWWVTNDMDHVRVRIPRPDKIGQGPIKVTIETTNPSTLSEFNDPANEVELTESTTEPGIFENVFLLVSDDVDDNFDGRDETLKDYTHKIAVGGELIIKYEGGQISRLKVKEKGRMKLRPLVLWYHGWFSGYPAVQTSEVENDVKDIRKRFAQAGIAVDWDGGAWGIDVNNVTGASDSFRDDGMQTLEDAGPTTDERSLSSYIASTYPSIGSKDIVMVYSKRLYAPGGWGTGLIGYDQKAYTLIPTFAASKGIRPMVVTTAQRDLHTMAHETLHMVLDDVHPPGHGKHDTEFLFWRRLWSGGIPGLGGGDANAYTDRKRMSKSEQDYVVPDVQKSPLVQP